MLVSPHPWRARGALVFTVFLGLLLEVILFAAVRHFHLFVGEDMLRDRLLLLGLCLGYVALSAQILHALWGVGRIPAMTLITLAAMWAWAAALVLVAFLVFLLFFALFFELYLPLRAALWLLQRGLTIRDR
ncbi:MAG: hypothetical protein ABIK09_00970 [Pseudomonadota bacterium]